MYIYIYLYILIYIYIYIYIYISSPGGLSTLVTSVVLYSLIRATLMSPGKDERRVCIYIFIYVLIVMVLYRYTYTKLKIYNLQTPIYSKDIWE